MQALLLSDGKPHSHESAVQSMPSTWLPERQLPRIAQQLLQAIESMDAQSPG
jgi:hypothetical protein